MKARIRKTGEIINIADYAMVTLDACDSYGNPIEMSFEDVEILQEKSDGIDWEARRFELVKAAMQGYCANPVLSDGKYVDVAIAAIEQADAVIEKLKVE